MAQLNKMWPQYVMVFLLSLQFAGDIKKANKQYLEKAQFVGVIMGLSIYYVFVIWILYKGGFF